MRLGLAQSTHERSILITLPDLDSERFVAGAKG